MPARTHLIRVNVAKQTIGIYARIGFLDDGSDYLERRRLLPLTRKTMLYCVKKVSILINTGDHIILQSKARCLERGITYTGFELVENILAPEVIYVN